MTSSPAHHALLRIAVAASTLLAIIGGIALTSQSDSALADENRTTSDKGSEQVSREWQRGLSTATVAARVAEAVRVEQEAAAQAAYLLTPAGAQETARELAASQYGWGEDQFSCLVSLWDRESGWNYAAYNASSGATGIPQSLPGEKMATFGADWQTNPATQIAWGLSYISSSYGTPCGAWSHSESYNWY